MIIGLVGYAQSGKDTIANILMEKHDFKRRAFADNVRNMLYDLDIEGLKLIVDTMGWDRAKRLPGVRAWLQKLGLSARDNIGQDVWVNATLDKLEPKVNYVITDVRFPNEADRIKSLGGSLWRVVRPGVGPVNAHISESALDFYDCDKVIINGSGLNGLASQIESIMNDL